MHPRQLQRGWAESYESQRTATWEYLVLTITPGEDGTGGRVVRVDGSDAARFALGSVGLQEALRFLGAEGWELVTAYGASAAGGNRQLIFKRPADGL
jgi:hypothetical protein